MGRTKESVSLLNWLFSDLNKAKSSCKVLVSVTQPTCLNEMVLDDFSLKLCDILIENFRLGIVHVKQCINDIGHWSLDLPRKSKG